MYDKSENGKTFMFTENWDKVFEPENFLCENIGNMIFEILRGELIYWKIGRVFLVIKCLISTIFNFIRHISEIQKFQGMNFIASYYRRSSEYVVYESSS